MRINSGGLTERRMKIFPDSRQMRQIFAVVIKLTFFRNDGDFVSSRKIGKIASRNLMNNSLFGSPS
jgi:hypothetical protein